MNEEALKPDKAGPSWPDATSSTARVHTHTDTHTQQTNPLIENCRHATAGTGFEINEKSGHQNAL